MPFPIASPPLNIAETTTTEDTLGPGLRAVVWVQGCPFSCPGCVAPDWIPQRPATIVAPGDLAPRLLADQAVTGLTFSGGEPMAQAPALAALARHCRQLRDVTLICFTGYRLERLRGPHAPAGATDLLDQIDVLIDGLYVADRNDGLGLRGSANQRIHHLTDRLRDGGYDFEHRRRTAEVRVRARDVLLVGVPPPGLLAAIDEATGPATPTSIAGSD